MKSYKRMKYLEAAWGRTAVVSLQHSLSELGAWSVLQNPPGHLSQRHMSHPLPRSTESGSWG